MLKIMYVPDSKDGKIHVATNEEMETLEQNPFSKVKLLSAKKII